MNRTSEIRTIMGGIKFAIFIASFTVLMLFTPLFESLRTEEVVRPIQTNKASKIAFFVTSAAATIFSMVVFLPIATAAVTATVPQTQSLAIGAWAFACGLFSILCMVIVYMTVGKKSGFDLAGGTAGNHHVGHSVWNLFCHQPYGMASGQLLWWKSAHVHSLVLPHCVYSGSKYSYFSYNL